MKQPSQNDINRLKKQVQQIMKVKGEEHNTWLYNQYQDYLSENTDVITKALQYYSQKDNKKENTVNEEGI